MTQITPHLTVFQGLLGDVYLHLTDAYGHVNGIVSLNEDECRALSQALAAATKPIVRVDIPAVVVEEEDVEVTEEAAPEVAEESPVDTDWSAMTKAEIVAKAEERFGVHLDANARKAVLVAAAVDLLHQETLTPEQARKVLAAAPAGSVYAEMARKVLEKTEGVGPRKF